MTEIYIDDQRFVIFDYFGECIHRDGFDGFFGVDRILEINKRSSFELLSNKDTYDVSELKTFGKLYVKAIEKYEKLKTLL